MRIVLLLFTAFLSAVLTIFAFPKFDLYILSWICLVPLFIISFRQQTKIVFFTAWISGILANAGVVYWLVPTFRTAGESGITGIAALIALSGYLGVYHGLYFIFAGWIFNKWKFNEKSVWFSHPGLMITLSAGWVVVELLKTVVLTGFPWALLGYTQYNSLWLIQICDITGVYGVSFVIVLVNIALALIVNTLLNEHKLNDKTARCVISVTGVAILILTGCYGYSKYRIQNIYAQIINAPEMRIAVLQGNIDQYKKWDQQFVTEIMGAYSKIVYAVSKNNDGLDLVAWPETAVPGYLLNEKRMYDWVVSCARMTRCAHLAGTVEYKDGEIYNSAVCLTPEGAVAGKYSKIHLVPFGEVVPLKKWLEKYIKTLTALGDVSPGKHTDPIRLKLASGVEADVGTYICFESIFGAEVTRFTKTGAQVLVNITNDGWYLNTAAPYQHFVFNIFRAVENRRYVVRSANTGISGFIDPTGKVAEKTQIFVPSAITFNVRLLDEYSFYTRFPYVFSLLCTALVLTLGLLCKFKN
ncbi:MAG: apolipoprotein N-acyltransferase [Elusimicrobiota bacterium]